MDKSEKILGGFTKTGSSSLNRALKHLGYTSSHHIGNLDSHKSRDAITDLAAFMPGMIEAAQMIYDLKFIFTVRDIDSWLESCEQHYSMDRQIKVRYPNDFILIAVARHSIFGQLFYNERVWKETYLRQMERVQTLFKDSSDRLLLLDIVGGEGWDKLCPFLGKPIPDILFPVKNKTIVRETVQNSVSRKFT